ncbi:MAG: T9SS type A sorting domain-containing protein [Bacteroidetes bacterium]|nr:T9SS type A sorting domain-containing protein [Bacteroidota bacterium]
MKHTLLSLFAVSVLGTSAMAQMPTMDFESWTSQAGPPAYNDPQGWATVNILSNVLLGGNPITVFRESNNPHGGTYCMRITSAALTSNPAVGQIPDTVGIALTGTITLFPTQGIFPGFAYSARPASISSYMRYAPAAAGDSCFFFAALTRWNGSGRDTIGVAGTVISTAVSNWTLYNMPFFYDPAFLNVQPDSFVIACSATDDEYPKVNSSMFVDDISLTGWVGMNDPMVLNAVNVFPNPASEFTTIRTNNPAAREVVVFDMTGREIARYAIDNGEVNADAWKMAAGVYNYTILDEKKEILSRGKFNVSH